MTSIWIQDRSIQHGCHRAAAPARPSTWLPGALLAAILLVWTTLAHGAWFDATWHYRVPISVPAGASVNSTVKVDVDFNALLAALGVAGTFDVNSPRITRPNDALSATQEFTDAVYAGATDATGNGRGEIRFLLEDAGPSTYYLYFDITANGTKAANPQSPINGNFERGSTGTQNPPGWTATKATANFDAQVRPSETPSITTDAGSPRTMTTDGTPNTGAFSYLIGSRSNNDTDRDPAVTLSRSFTVPATNPGNLVIRYRPEGWDSCDNGATQYDCLRIRLVGSTTTELVGPTAGNYYSFPFSPNKGANAYSNNNPGYGRYNYWDIDGRGNHDPGGMTIAAGAEVWFTYSYSLASYAGQTVTLQFISSHINQYKTWFHIDDVEWSVIASTLGTPETAVVNPGGSNAYETTTAAGAITGVIKTKISGLGFNLDVIALDAAKTAIETRFAGAVKIELLNASNNSGALDANGCRSTWTLIQTLAANPSFITADSGRKTVAFLENNAWPNVRVRITYPASGTATAVGCSNDNFAIRPASFTAPSASDSDWASAGTARMLTNTSASGGVVHKAGQPFTLRASAINGAATPAVTTNYSGTPSALVSLCAAGGCGAVPGTLSFTTAAVSGSITANDARYSEAGALSLQLVDSSYASVDAGDSSAAERNITSPLVAVGRFVPDHFDITAAAVPVFKTFNDTSCATRSFTYIGQGFGYLTLPRATITARNAAGTTTASYRGALWKLSAASLTQTYAPLVPAVPGLDISGVGTVSVASNNDGTGSYAANSGDLLVFVRNTTAPQAQFNANISLSVSAADGSESAVAGNGTITSAAPLVFNGSGSGIAFDAGSLFRYGRLRLGNAYGSERLDLPVPLTAQYWNGYAFVTNTADHCTTIDAANIKLSGYQPAGFAASVPQANVSISGRLAAGIANLKLLKPAPAASGSLNLCVDLDSGAAGDTTCQASTPAARAYLQDRRTGAAYTQDPAGRAAFGLYKGPNNFIYLRENY